MSAGVVEDLKKHHNLRLTIEIRGPKSKQSFKAFSDELLKLVKKHGGRVTSQTREVRGGGGPSGPACA